MMILVFCGFGKSENHNSIVIDYYNPIKYNPINYRTINYRL